MVFSELTVIGEPFKRKNPPLPLPGNGGFFVYFFRIAPWMTWPVPV